jgi:transposase
MFQDSEFSALLWEGFCADLYKPEGEWLHIHLSPAAGQVLICPRCHTHSQQIHDVSYRRVRERDLFDFKVLLHVPVRRLRCRKCGPRVQEISWLAPGARLTRRLQAHIEALSRLLPIKHIAQLLVLSWHTIKAIDKHRLQREVQPPDWSTITELVMDEFALFKGHRYASVVADARTHQVLWVGEGRSRAAIRPFFEQLGEHAVRIEAVAMDMNTAFDLEVQKHCPNAVVVYDLFHVIAKYGREVIDRVRLDEVRAQPDTAGRRWIKRARWVLLKNRQNMDVSQQDYLAQLLAANRNLTVVYLLKEQLKELWYCSTREQALLQWELWWQQVQESGLEPLQRFAARLKPYLHGIVASATYRLHTSRLEGINNKIKVIKRMAYGYRDTEYFFLKIRAAFPGIRR